jgi:hypothetical protein
MEDYMKMHMIKIIALGLLLTVANNSTMKAEPTQSNNSIVEENEAPEAGEKCLSFAGSCLVP